MESQQVYIATAYLACLLCMKSQQVYIAIANLACLLCMESHQVYIAIVYLACLLCMESHQVYIGFCFSSEKQEPDTDQYFLKENVAWQSQVFVGFFLKLPTRSHSNCLFSMFAMYGKPSSIHSNCQFSMFAMYDKPARSHRFLLTIFAIN